VSGRPSDLERQISELQGELARLPTLDADSRALLEDVHRDIEAVLERSEETQRRGLRERLEAAIQHFEESHPTLTAAMGRVIDQLANLGI
jgi:hypothetical protein